MSYINTMLIFYGNTFNAKLYTGHVVGKNIKIWNLYPDHFKHNNI